MPSHESTYELSMSDVLFEQASGSNKQQDATAFLQIIVRATATEYLPDELCSKGTVKAEEQAGFTEYLCYSYNDRIYGGQPTRRMVSAQLHGSGLASFSSRGAPEGLLRTGTGRAFSAN
ncbi:hypothetical protein WJX73_005998 [Symbiochloris irregularis]|uniref:Uncharacterized protein n=1 Tax=Symbiochloris irregularis TaxID=706552 RepID=A0AAW1P5I2_9CHLO